MGIVFVLTAAAAAQVKFKSSCGDCEWSSGRRRIVVMNFLKLGSNGIGKG